MKDKDQSRLSRENNHRRAVVLAGILMVALYVPLVAPLVADSIPQNSSTHGFAQPDVSSNLVGTCVYVGNITLALPSGTHESMHFSCSGAPTVTLSSTGIVVTLSNGTTKKLNSHVTANTSVTIGRGLVLPNVTLTSSNFNNVIGWTSGSCTTASGAYCTDTQVSEGSTMVPNTSGWSVQDNAYGGDFCGYLLRYQNTANVGTSVNNYYNRWGVAFGSYPYCIFPPNVTENFYSFLSGTNLNSDTTFETYYALTSNYPTTAWLIISHGSNYYSYSQSMPSGSPHIGIGGWEDVVVCDFNGCNTNFKGGGGTIYYYQNHMHAYNPETGTYTIETSNCNYGSVTINSFDNQGTQSFSCP